jgi:hypothetical protein
VEGRIREDAVTLLKKGRYRVERHLPLSPKAAEQGSKLFWR